MATHRTDVSVLFGVPAEPIPLPGDESHGSARGVNTATVEPTPLATLGVVTTDTSVRVPDVVLSTESQARASLAAAGLAPGIRNPEPRPVTGRSEVVIRTFPRAGSLIPAGSRVDYELLPGEPRNRAKPGDYADYDSAASLDVVVEQPAPDAAGADLSPYVDYDVIDTLFRVGSRPVGSRV